MNLPSQRQYPRRVYIGDTFYKVKFVKSLGKDVVGLCDAGKETIFIVKGLGPLATFKTFLHELLHAVEFAHDIPIKHKTIRLLEEALADLLIQNL